MSTEEEIWRELEQAERLVRIADARLRLYAYAPHSDEDLREKAMGDWYAAEDVVWQALRISRHNPKVVNAFADVGESMTRLIQALGEAMEPPVG